MKTTCILALLSLSMLCSAPLSAQIPDSTKADTVLKARENWYLLSGSLGIGLGTDVKPPTSLGIPIGVMLVFLLYGNHPYSVFIHVVEP